RPRIAIEIGARIARAPIHEIELGIVAAGDPSRAAAALPGGSGPCVAARLARLRNGVEAPDVAARGDIEGIDVAAHAVFAARRADQDFVLDDERRQRGALAGADIGEDGLPDRTARSAVER